MASATLRQLGGAVEGVFGRWLDRVAAPASPTLAVECAPGRLIAARSEGGGVRAAAAGLPPGVITASATRANVADAAALAGQLRPLLEAVGAAGQAVALLVPDLTARLALLEFDAIPVRRDEQQSLARFRLRKSLPFAEEGAVFSCQPLDARRLLVGFADRARLDEYENLLEAAGATAATVLPSGLAACAAHAVLDHAALLLRAEPGCLTSAFCWHGRLEFFRVLELGAEPSFDDVFPSVAFFRDRIEAAGGGAGAAPVLYCIGLEAELRAGLAEAAPWAELRTPEIAVQAAVGVDIAAADALAVAGLLRGRFA